MTNWRNLILGVALSLAALPTFAVPITLPSGANITSAVESAAIGDTIELSPGDYYAMDTDAWKGQNAFGISKAVKIIGLGATPADVRLHGISGGNYSVLFTGYAGNLGNPSGASLENVTIDTGPGGVRILDDLSGLSRRLTDITIKDVVIRTAMTGGVFGVHLENTDRIVIDNATVTSFQSAFFLVNAKDTLMMNSTVKNTGTEAAAGLAVLGGSGNTLVGNTFGSPKEFPASNSNYSFAGGGVVFYNTQANRFENNTVQGHRDDGLDFHALDLSPNGIPLQQSTDNYVGKNNVISTGFAAGRTAGSGIWLNCSSNNSWVYANDSHGSSECGACVWLSKNNMVLANSLRNNRLIGLFVSGGQETLPLCPIPTYRVKPSDNFVRSNNIYYNDNAQVIVRNSDSTDISLNFLSPRNGFGGAFQPCVASPNCQSAFTLEGDPATPASTSNGVVLAANTSANNQRGIQSDNGFDKVTGIDFFFNRMLFSSTNVIFSSNLNLDRGASLGGNFWTQHSASGNPSSSTPYTGVSPTGSVPDRFPYQTEDFGRGYSVTVFEPYAGTVAQGTRKTVRWYSPGCTYADISLDGATDLASNVANIGYAVVTIPTSASVGVHTIVVKCKDSLGINKGQGSSGPFTVRNASLQLMAPGRDDVFNAGQPIFVAWKKSSAITSVNIDFSSDKGVTFTPLLSGQTGTFARVTLPGIESRAYAVIRITSGSAAGDSTDGVFAVRGTGAGFANVSSGRKFVMGQLERLEWSSPQNSRLVDITATVGGTTRPVATNLPDRGNFDWIVPDRGAGVVTLTANFKTTTGLLTISSASTSLGSSLYPTTITFGAAPSLAVGGNANVIATANPAVAITFTSLTPSVCSISGSTVTGGANGVCTIAANAPGGGNYNAALQVTQNITVGAVASTRLANLSTRGQVQTGDNVMIGGLIIGGASPKTVLIRAVGPNLANFGVPGVLANPTLQLFSGQTAIASNDDWGNASNAAAIQATGLAPAHSLESAILMTLAPGPYTAIVSGVGGGTGVGIVETFEIDNPGAPLINIATRGRVETGDNVMIGGFIIQGSTSQTVLIRAVGPNLANFGVQGVLANPTLQLFSGQTVIASNDDWQSASNAAAIQATGLAPANPLESAILVTLAPGAYTAIVSGVGGGTGVGIVEVFAQ